MFRVVSASSNLIDWCSDLLLSGFVSLPSSVPWCYYHHSFVGSKESARHQISDLMLARQELCCWAISQASITIAFLYNFKSGIKSGMPNVLPLFPRIVVSIYGIFWLQINFRIFFPNSVKSAIGILIRMAFILTISIFITLLFPTKARIIFNFLISSDLFHNPAVFNIKIFYLLC